MNKFFQKNKTLIFISIAVLLVVGFVYFLSNFRIESDNFYFPRFSREDNLHKVIRVIDGDTIIADVNGKKERIRLIGINTPETVDPRKPVECFGAEASNRAKKILNNKKVRLEADNLVSERDKYGRLLRYVFLEDGSNFNKMMIADGYAYEYTYDLPYKYQNEFKQAEKEARKAERGLWADGACDDFFQKNN